MAELTVNTGLRFLFVNVAVIKSRHRLLFYPTKEKGKRIVKTFFEMFLSTRGIL